MVTNVREKIDVTICAFPMDRVNVNNNLQMTGFEMRASGIGSDRSAN